jgi:hypothetical protein
MTIGVVIGEVTVEDDRDIDGGETHLLNFKNNYIPLIFH